jgi:hypothetical protein
LILVLFSILPLTLYLFAMLTACSFDPDDQNGIDPEDEDGYGLASEKRSDQLLMESATKKTEAQPYYIF